MRPRAAAVTRALRAVPGQYVQARGKREQVRALREMPRRRNARGMHWSVAGDMPEMPDLRVGLDPNRGVLGLPGHTLRQKSLHSASRNMRSESVLPRL